MMTINILPMRFFDIDHIFFQIWDYNVSYLEFYGLLTGIIAVVLASLANVWSWPIGLINVTLSFFLFFQVQLYPDMFLQAFFFATNIVGWWRWTHPRPFEEDRRHELRISRMNIKEIISTCIIGFGGTFLLGLLATHLHDLLPTIFTQPSAAPFLDSFITVMSIIATFYMIQKKIECWAIWLLVDVIATYLYFVRDIKFYAILYLAFCAIAAFALLKWVREYKSYRKQRL